MNSSITVESAGPGLFTSNNPRAVEIRSSRFNRERLSISGIHSIAWRPSWLGRCLDPGRCNAPKATPPARRCHVTVLHIKQEIWGRFLTISGYYSFKHGFRHDWTTPSTSKHRTRPTDGRSILPIAPPKHREISELRPPALSLKQSSYHQLAGVRLRKEIGLFR